MSLPISDQAAAASRRAPLDRMPDTGGARVYRQPDKVIGNRRRAPRCSTICADRALSPELIEFFMVAALGVRTTKGSSLGHCGYRERRASHSRGNRQALGGAK